MVVYTDGACRNNQDPRFRRAGVGAFWARGHSANVSQPLEGWAQTNQRAELEALRCVFAAEFRPVIIKSDSAYVVEGCNTHLKLWRLAKWRGIENGDQQELIASEL